MQRRHFVRSATVFTFASLAQSACRRPAVSRSVEGSESDVSMSGPSSDSLDAVVPRAMDLAGVPGVSVGVLRSGQITQRFWGVADVRTNAPLTGESRFEAASLSKPVTACLAIMLARRGMLDLDRPLARYGVLLPNPDDPRAARITARHVLSHSTGWRNWRRASDPPLTAEFEPGTRYQYSGEGFVQLQRAIEHLTDRGFAELAATEVFAPFGMTRSTFLITSVDGGPALVAGHSARRQPRESHGLRVGRHLARHAPAGRAPATLRVAEVEALLPSMDPPSPPIPAFVMPNAAGSLVTTVSDYLTFWSRLLSADSQSPEGGALERMMQLETPINSVLSWGLGIARETVDGEIWLWHQGDNPGFKNFLTVDPGRRSAVVVFTNGDSGMRVAERATRAVTRRDHGAFVWL